MTFILAPLWRWRTHGIASDTKQQAEASVRMAKEMEETRAAQFVPIVAFGSSQQASFVFSETAFLPNSERVVTGVRNIGTGPALNLELVLSHPTVKYSPVTRSFLGKEEGFYATFLPVPAEKPTSTRVYAVLSARYQDVFSNHFETRATFTRDAEISDGFHHPQMTFEKLGGM